MGGGYARMRRSAGGCGTRSHLLGRVHASARPWIPVMTKYCIQPVQQFRAIKGKNASGERPASLCMAEGALACISAATSHVWAADHTSAHGTSCACE